TAGCNVSQYYLYVGTSAGGNDIYGVSQGANLSGQVTGIPTNGARVYVRLWSFTTVASNSLTTGWHFIDYTYTAAGSGSGCGTATAAGITNPTPGSTLPGGSATFTWNSGSCATSYTLSVGTSVGANNIFQGTAGVSVTAT